MKHTCITRITPEQKRFLPSSMDEIIKRDMSGAIAKEIMKYHSLEKESSPRGGDHYRLSIYSYKDETISAVIFRLREMNKTLFNPDISDIISILSK